MSDPTSRVRLTRRSLFGAAAATLGTAAVIGAAGSIASPGAALAAAPAGFPQDLEKLFRKPGTASAAGFRWWWPHGLVDPVEIAREVDQVADAGFGYLEVADVTHSLRARSIDIDVATNGWGTAPWVAGVKAALARAAKRDVRIDITVGPSWPAAVSTITPDDAAACTELVHGQAQVPAGTTYDAALPEPLVEAGSSVTRSTLVTVQAHRITGYVRDRNNVITSTLLDPASWTDLTALVVGEHLTWTAPADPAGGTWILLATWSRGSGQEPEAAPHTSPRSYVVDHFSPLGVQAVIDLWEDRVLDGEMRALLRAAGGNLFEDSLEIETEATIWTPTFLDDFEKSRGYDLRPWLPFVLELKEKYQFSLAATDPTTADSLRTNEIRDDYNQVLSDLYLDCHLRPLQDFARGLGLGIRIQPYGLETDTMRHSAVIDVPETESLGFKNLDDYRIMASGRDMAGHSLLSCEAICYNGAAYNTTWGANTASPTAQNQALFTINSIFAAGVNRLMIHGFPYATGPGRHVAGVRRLLALLQQRDRLRRGVGSAHPAVGARPRHRRLHRPHAAGAADRDTAVRHRVLAAQGLGFDRHRSAVDHQQRHQARLVALVHERVAAGARRGDGPWRTPGARRTGVQGTRHRSGLVAQQRRHHGHRRREASARARQGGPADRPHRRLVGGHAGRA